MDILLDVLRISSRVVLLLVAAWATFAASTLLIPKPRKVAFVCPFPPPPDCPGGGLDLEVEILRPSELTEFVFRNEFVLEGVVRSPHRPITFAILQIWGRYPSSLPFIQINSN